MKQYLGLIILAAGMSSIAHATECDAKSGICVGQTSYVVHKHHYVDAVTWANWMDLTEVNIQSINDGRADVNVVDFKVLGRSFEQQKPIPTNYSLAELAKTTGCTEKPVKRCVGDKLEFYSDKVQADGEYETIVGLIPSQQAMIVKLPNGSIEVEHEDSLGEYLYRVSGCSQDKRICVDQDAYLPLVGEKVKVIGIKNSEVVLRYVGGRNDGKYLLNVNSEDVVP